MNKSLRSSKNQKLREVFEAFHDSIQLAGVQKVEAEAVGLLSGKSRCHRGTGFHPIHMPARDPHA